MATVRGQTAYTWSGGSATDSNWTDGANWSGGVAPASSAATDIILTTSNRLDSTVNTPYTIGGISFDGGAGAFTVTGSTLTISGQVPASGPFYGYSIINASSNTQTINNNLVASGNFNIQAASAPLILGGNVNYGANTLSLGSSSAAAPLTFTGSFTGSSGGSIQFNGTGNVVLAGNSSGINGGLLLAGGIQLNSNNALPSVYVYDVGGASSVVTGAAVTVGTSVTVGNAANTFTIGGVSADRSTFTSNVNIGPFTTSSGAAPQPINLTAAAGGVTTFSGSLVRDGGANGGNADNLVKVGAGTVVLAGSGNNFQGTMSVNAGTLLVTGTTTGGGMYTVTSGATLGGAGGTIGTNNANVTLNAGAFLNVSNAGTTNVLTSGRLTLNLGTGVLNLGSVATGTSHSLVFQLAQPAASDQVVTGTGSTINIGTGKLAFGDFSFVNTTGFQPGAYVLFDTASANGITGSLASTGLSGTVNGYSATLGLSTDSFGNGDLILNVTAVPEPSQWVPLLGFLCVVAILRYRRVLG